MRTNLQMEKVIIENTHLIEGESMPRTFCDLLAHVEVYRVTLKRWEAGDYSEHSSYLNFPLGFAKEIGTTFEDLKKRQAALAGLPKAAPTVNSP